MGNYKNAQTGFRVKPDTIDKLKYIAWKENESMNSKAETAFDDLIAKWEKKNGVITSDMLKIVQKK